MNRRCLHCDAPYFNSARFGHRAILCFTCRSNRAIRSLYVDARPTPTPSTEAPVELPPPTDAQPGTKQKVDVLEERRERRQQLWHPLDAGMSTSDLEEFLA